MIRRPAHIPLGSPVESGDVELDASVPLALRKQMLVMRAAVQREEMAQSVRALRRAVSGARTGGLSWAGVERVLSIWKLSRAHPSMGSALGSLLSLGLARWRWPAWRYVGLALSAAWLGYQAWDLIRRARSSAQPQRPRPRSAAPAPAASSPGASRAASPAAAVSAATGEQAGVSADLALLRRMQELARLIDEGR